MKCALEFCSNSKHRCENVSFHKFPEDAPTLEFWLKSIEHPELKITKSSRICSDHFDDEDLIHMNSRTRLSILAFPKLEVTKYKDGSKHGLNYNRSNISYLSDSSSLESICGKESNAPTFKTRLDAMKNKLPGPSQRTIPVYVSVKPGEPFLYLSGEHIESDSNLPKELKNMQEFSKRKTSTRTEVDDVVDNSTANSLLFHTEMLEAKLNSLKMTLQYKNKIIYRLRSKNNRMKIKIDRMKEMLTTQKERFKYKRKKRGLKILGV